MKVWKRKTALPKQAAPSSPAEQGRRLLRGASLPVLCYLVALVLWLAEGIFNCGNDAVARAAGRLRVEVLPLESLQLVDLEPTQTGYLTTSGDPQIILEDAEAGTNRVIRTLSYHAEYPGAEPREICLYYTTKPGEPYSADRRVFPQVTAAGDYLFTLPRTTLAALRLDICSPDPDRPVEVVLTPAALVLNGPLTMPGFADYFIPSWYQVFCLVLYPALAAALLNWGAAVIRWLRRRATPQKAA